MNGQLLEFEPLKLTWARERTQVVHPGTASRPPPPDLGLLARLRARVEKAADDEGRLRQLSRRLSPAEVRALVGGLERWEDLRGACGTLVRLRLNERLLPVLWGSWQRHPLVSEIQALLLEAGGRFGWERVLPSPYVDAVEGWIRDPGRGIQGWLDRQGLAFTEVPDLNGRPIRADSPLERLVRDSVMAFGSANQLRADAEHLIDWVPELSPETSILFGQNYLSSLRVEEWDWAVLNWLRELFGVPRRPKVERFWAPLPENVRRAFQRLYIESRIEEELGHDDDRERFWKQWADKMVDVVHGRAGSVRYADLDFGEFVVFEFFETGNAAYFYLPQDAARMRRRHASAPRALKDKRFYYFEGGDNRLIHNPPHGWHSKGNEMVNRWLKFLRHG